MSIYDCFFMMSISVIMLIILFIGKKENRFKRFAVAVIVIPIIIIMLHITCFFDTVPHCLDCIIIPDGEEAEYYPTDANQLKSAGMMGYFIVVLILTPIIVKKDVSKEKRSIVVGLMILYIIFVAFPIWAMRYM